MHVHKHTSTGVTLIELMIVVAIISIISAIAIPTYNGYILEAKISTARANMDSMRVFLEDYKLETGSYGSGSTSNLATLQSTYGWSPDGDNGLYTYTLSASTSSYDITVSSADVTVTCTNRMSTCTSSP